MLVLVGLGQYILTKFCRNRQSLPLRQRFFSNVATAQSTSTFNIHYPTLKRNLKWLKEAVDDLEELTKRALSGNEEERDATEKLALEDELRDVLKKIVFPTAEEEASFSERQQLFFNELKVNYKELMNRLKSLLKATFPKEKIRHDRLLAAGYKEEEIPAAYCCGVTLQYMEKPSYHKLYPALIYDYDTFAEMVENNPAQDDTGKHPIISDLSFTMDAIIENKEMSDKATACYVKMMLDKGLNPEGGTLESVPGLQLK
ncbi:MAG: hypothetical protein H2069_10290 [Legionella sp.]|nr:hypothetical protein [Legionella sp.]